MYIIYAHAAIAGVVTHVLPQAMLLEWTLAHLTSRTGETLLMATSSWSPG